MIDVENYVVDRVYRRFKDEPLKVKIHSTHVRSPSEFPCLMLYESASSTYDLIRFGDGIERYANVRFTAEICTNDRQGKKEKAKKILNVLDDEMQAMGFYRASRNYTFGTDESSVFIALATYRGLVGESPSGDGNDLKVYRR